MKCNCTLLLVLSSLYFTGQAQQPDEVPVIIVPEYSLEQCLAYTKENAISIKNAELDTKIAQARVNEVLGLGLPQISGSSQVLHNNTLRRFFTTYTKGGIIDLSAVPDIQYGDVVGVRNIFQLRSSGEMSVSASQIIFNASLMIGIQASKASSDLSKKLLRQTQEQTTEQLTKAFYTALINRERLVLFRSNLDRIDSLLYTTKALHESGFVEQIDVDRIQVLRNNASIEYEQSISLFDLSISWLKFHMNYPQDQPLKIKGNFDNLKIDSTRAELVFENRPDYVVLQANKKLQQFNIRNKKYQQIPTISAFGTWGYNTQSPNIAGLFKTNSQFSSQETVGPDTWYPFSFFGFSLNVPIFSGFQGSSQIQQEKFRLLQIENTIKSLENTIYVETQQAQIQLTHALKALRVQQQNTELALEVARITKIKYEEGVGSNMEVTEAENSLAQTQVNYYNALFNAIMAKIDLDKAYGTLTY